MASVSRALGKLCAPAAQEPLRLHDWDDEQEVRLVQLRSRALTPGGTLLSVEMVLLADNRPSPVQPMDLKRLVMRGGRERTADEYARLLAVAGFHQAPTRHGSRATPVC